MSKKKKKKDFYLTKKPYLTGETEPFDYSDFCQHEKGWKVENEIIETCGFIQNSEPTIDLNPEVYQKIVALSKEMDELEWGGYLLGEGQQVDDLIIPKQEVTGGTWETDKRQYPSPEIARRIIGTVHSHNSMESFTSSVDKEYVVANYPVTLIWGNGQLRGWLKEKLPCGKFYISEASISIIPRVELTGWVNQAKKNIKQKTTSVATYSTQNGWKRKYHRNHDITSDYEQDDTPPTQPALLSEAEERRPLVKLAQEEKITQKSNKEWCGICGENRVGEIETKTWGMCYSCRQHFLTFPDDLEYHYDEGEAKEVLKRLGTEIPLDEL